MKWLCLCFVFICTLLWKHVLNDQFIGASLRMWLNSEDQSLLKEYVLIEVV